MNIIEVHNLSFRYSQAEVLRNISFKIKTGTFLAVVGPNGVGKSTLLNLLSAGLKPDTGSVKIDGKTIGSYSTKKLAGKIAVVRQEFIPIFSFSVIETVMISRTTHYGQLGFETETDRDIVNEALEVTDTAQFASRLLSNLSAGERQRVFIARALAQQTPILLLDEPTSFLDLKHQVNIYDLLKTTQLKQGKTIIAVTHDINLAAQYCDTILLLASDGRYCYGDAREVLTVEKITDVFGVRIFSGKIRDESFFIPIGKSAKDSEKFGTTQGNI
ncbi:MAG: ABC transporter ATP-binding protein [Sedimentisphaerales bacterium]|nr:ABC transporter ATP-binding protein [Sedimentisphaerales bacterium]